MALPELIELLPLPPKAATSTITVPGSKSITNRALILAALSSGSTILQGALWSEDTEVMVDCLQRLGLQTRIAPDPSESCNRQLHVQGMNGQIPPGGTASAPLRLHVGNAGTAARFLTALLCLGSGVYELHGVPRMHERPQAALFQALRQLGYQIDSPNDRLPCLIHGAGPRPGACSVSIRESSQFASALLLCARAGRWQVAVHDENAEESPYVHMTSELLKVFPHRGGTFQIEPDASSGSYFWAAQFLLQSGRGNNPGRLIQVLHWPTSGWQIDARFHQLWPLPERISRRDDLGDSILSAMAAAPFSPRPVLFTDLGRLRVQECERVSAMRTELSKCGAQVMEQDDTLLVNPGPLHSARICTYNDHRIAMSFATLGLKVPGIQIENPRCVRKTFPNFYQKLAAPPPHGLGATILDRTCPGDPKPLALEELSAA